MNETELFDNVTLTITNTSDAIYKCTEMALNSYLNATFYFDKFEDWD